MATGRRAPIKLTGERGEGLGIRSSRFTRTFEPEIAMVPHSDRHVDAYWGSHSYNGP